MAFVTLDNVYKRYHMGEITINAADGMTFDIQKGEFAIIVGPSGSGKTTVLNMLGGMDTCDEGVISVDGERIDRFNRRQLTNYRRYDVGFIFQFYNLMPNLTAKENVELAAQTTKDFIPAAEILQKVGLGERLQNFPAQLSGGDIVLDETTLTLRNVHTGESVRLGDKEFRILEYFLRNRGRILTRDQLVQRVWGYDSDAEYNKIEVYLTFTRKKLAFIGSDAKIKAVRGVGYELQLPDEVRS